MKREIRTTADGSKTLFINELNEGYHSHHGALQEAKHVFIKNGLARIEKIEFNILELGFGTGLNVLVTAEALMATNISKINYYTIEKYPVTSDEIQNMGFEHLFENTKMASIYEKIHSCEWETLCSIMPKLSLKKIKSDFHNLENIELPTIDLVYFDCFGARVQPDLWELPLVKMVSDKMTTGSLLSTYSSKGSFQRVLKSLNFNLEKLEGPKGKREMINAWKT
ncbi:tRNA (5-methylaminomethyl-2-thiouridine)(34)-methyltransferase MnmD [Riemerella columbipharyngis]|uniref:tRNA U34 5-methylaminomethyl-2-thiouridine-forming methyltransferase MnmC n=1 Tax=Riemerella columbipharyngis TaxID=1071918 RepID=A0A1G6ZK15_9FLAO|nr:tRNA (5-methylaminomethyl-2-thiouridine)(34)-methyltransferase MnmD [Riemerella columbipharyngis]SDE02743.1 tRNA U34 5-methylaminomethyl-2-thiouridine-forming methyltransferase MnmC [Riemerella columbipharyngis]